MISVQKAEKLILSAASETSISKQKLLDSYHCILAEDIFADRDYPPFDKSLMDGIAVDHKTVKKGIHEFGVVGIQTPGKKALAIKNSAECTQIMTGAVLTQNTDCVIPYENVTIKNNIAKLKINPKIGKHINVKKKGADQKKGSLLIAKNTFLNPAEIGICASVGKSTIKVRKKLKIAIISTGDEIVDINKNPSSFKIRKSNSYVIDSALKKSFSVNTKLFHFKDNESVLKTQIKPILKEYDIIILTGGVSMGKFDFIPKVLKSLAVKEIFHKISQRPGKPLWFGLTNSKKAVFGLPGNPVSTQVCLYRYIYPYIQKSLGKDFNIKYIKLKNPVKLNTKFTVFLPVKVRNLKDGSTEAQAINTKGSGNLFSLANSDGFIEIQQDIGTTAKGYVGKYYSW